MGRKKLKYRDVVGGKNKGTNKNKLNKHPKPRKTYSLNKKDNINKRKYISENNHNRSGQSKRIKVENNVQPLKVQSSSSESEEEIKDPMQELRETFSMSKTKVYQAIDSESDSESQEESNENQNYEENEKSYEIDEKEESSEESDPEDLEKLDLTVELDTEKENAEIENENDPFIKHLFYELHSSLLESLESTPINVNSFIESWPKLGNLLIQIPKCDKIEETHANKLNEKNLYALPGKVPQKIHTKSESLMTDLYVKSQIVPNIPQANSSSLLNEKRFFTPLQSELFSIINNYQDLYFPERTFDNAAEVRFIYCLHIVNHILKTRLKILHHNARLSKKEDVPEEFRDQGLVRPKVLIVVPFKSSAYRIVETIIKIIFKDQENVIKKNRFVEDYTGNELYFPKKNPKPEDYEQTFVGNTSDDFKIGITVTKKSLKLYADFYSSDIIIGSPLGLRTIIGAEGEASRDYDFLASIELLIFDQMEVFLMQNWDHVNHIFNHIHLKPKDLHGTDVSRVRQWSLNFWAKYYRQTLIFSSLVLPEINSVFNKKCLNYAGKVKVMNPVEHGSINKIFVQLPHVFHRFDAGNPLDSVEARFDFFVNKILPQQKDSLMKQTMVFIPSYFDYVRVRNYLKKEDIGFVQICEYSKEGKVARARDMFYHGDAHFLLYTERYHYYNRIRVKGIRHLVFYQLPNFPHFYYELCNLMQESNMNKKVGNLSNMTVTVIYSKYDVLQLAEVVGTERASKISQSDRKVHMMVTGSD